MNTTNLRMRPLTSLSQRAIASCTTTCSRSSPRMSSRWRRTSPTQSGLSFRRILFKKLTVWDLESTLVHLLYCFTLVLYLPFNCNPVCPSVVRVRERETLLEAMKSNTTAFPGARLPSTTSRCPSSGPRSSATRTRRGGSLSLMWTTRTTRYGIGLRYQRI